MTLRIPKHALYLRDSLNAYTVTQYLHYMVLLNNRYCVVQCDLKRTILSIMNINKLSGCSSAPNRSLWLRSHTKTNRINYAYCSNSRKLDTQSNTKYIRVHISQNLPWIYHSNKEKGSLLPQSGINNDEVKFKRAELTHATSTNSESRNGQLRDERIWCERIDRAI